MKTQTAKLNNLHIAPRKVRQIADLLRGLPIREAEAQLLMRNQRSSKPLLKLLRSAAANAQNNQKLNQDQLFVSRIFVNQGQVFKRFLPRAMGKATSLMKRTSHITLVLGELEKPVASRFVITLLPKKEKKIKKEQNAKKSEKSKEEKIIKKPEKVGVFKRLFRRKNV